MQDGKFGLPANRSLEILIFEIIINSQDTIINESELLTFLLIS